MPYWNIKESIPPLFSSSLLPSFPPNNKAQLLTRPSLTDCTNAVNTQIDLLCKMVLLNYRALTAVPIYIIWEREKKFIYGSVLNIIQLIYSFALVGITVLTSRISLDPKMHHIPLSFPFFYCIDIFLELFKISFLNGSC